MLCVMRERKISKHVSMMIGVHNVILLYVCDLGEYMVCYGCGVCECGVIDVCVDDVMCLSCTYPVTNMSMLC